MAVATAYNVQPVVFHGRGREYFGIWFINALLTSITLGLYYPWARANRLRYLTSCVELDGSRFNFHGTGAEIFKGFIKAWLVIFSFGALYFYALMTQQPALLGIVVLLWMGGLFALLGILIHGAVRYRASRTSWRGIRFSYDGSRKELTLLCMKGIFLTIITFGIYSFWFGNNIRRYVLGHLRYGTARFSYNGSGGDLFIMGLKAMILTIPTLYIYLIEYQRARMVYFFNHIKLHDEDPALAQLGTLQFHCNHRFLPLLGLMFTNVLLLIFTLGLAFPWVFIRTLAYVYDNLEVAGDLALDYVGRGGAPADAGAGADAFLDASGLDEALDVGDFGLI